MDDHAKGNKASAASESRVLYAAEIRHAAAITENATKGITVRGKAEMALGKYERTP